jgi:uncharacterized membrane protein YwzB
VVALIFRLDNNTFFSLLPSRSFYFVISQCCCDRHFIIIIVIIIGYSLSSFAQDYLLVNPGRQVPE